jgi:hypothetical protein
MWREFLDGESEAPIHRELTLHQKGCADCRQLVATLDGGRTLAAELLDHLDGSVPARRVAGVLTRPRASTSPRSLLVAAVVALCVVTAAGATVRAGLVQRAMHWLLGPAPQIESHYPPTPPPAAPQAGASTGIAFLPAGAVEIVFEEWPQKGEIEIALRQVSEVSVTASLPSAYSVRAGRVIVANRGLAASYRIILPLGMSVATIRVGNRVVFSQRGTSLKTRATRTGPDSYLLPFSPGAEGP